MWCYGALKTHLTYRRITKDLDLHLPDMIFPRNELRVQHKSGWEMSFNAIDALKLVDNKRDLFKVSYADAWHRAK